MGFIVKAVKSVVKTVVGIVAKVAGAIFGFSTGSKTKSAKKVNNLNKSLEPEAYRKICFGRIAAALDIRYWEVWGTNGQNYDEIIALAGHRINAIGDLYFEDALGVNAAGVSQGIYVGVVTRTDKLGAVGQTSIAVGGGTQWTAANAPFDGTAYIKLAWVPDEKKLPNGISSRYTQIVEGALVYDPRRDSTQPGGSGAHRANDRTTWQYSPLDANGQPIGRNNALQALWYLLGWTIPTKDSGGTVTGEMLVLGRGVLPEDINMATFIAGANACETAGYYTDMVLTSEDSHTSNEDKITCNGLIGRLIDPGGLWSYYANVNDTASVAVYLTDTDIIQGQSVTWNEFKGMGDQFNQVRGKFIYPATPVLFQAFPYPMVRDATYETNLGIKRAKPLDFEQVLDSTLAQRLARLFLNEGQYQGEFQAAFNYNSLKAQAWSVVSYTSERFGFTKLFRVWRQDISTDGGISMLLKEIHSSIWSAGTVTAPLAPGLGLAYQATQQISPTAVTVTLTPMTGAGGTLADGFTLSWAAPSNAVRRTEVRYRLAGTSSWLTAGPVERDVTSITIGPELSGAVYEAFIRHISINEVAGPWVGPTTSPANGLSQFALGTTGNVNHAAIEAAGGTAIWANITGPNKPSDNAGTTLTFITQGTASAYTIAGNTVTQIVTNGTYTQGFYSSQSFKGGAACSFRNVGTAGRIFGGLDTSPTAGYSYTDLDYAGYRNGSTFDIYESGVFKSSHAGITDNTVITITYDGVNVKYWMDSILVRTIAAAADLVFYFHASSADINAVLKDIQFWPFTDNVWSSVGGAGKPENNADVTATAQIIINSPTEVTVNHDHTGTVLSGQLPRIIVSSVTKGGVSVRTDNTTTYALQNVSASLTTIDVNNINGSADKGKVTLTAMSASGSYQLIVTVNGVEQPAITVSVVKAVANPQATGSSGGNKTGSSNLSNAAIATLNTTFTQQARFNNLTKAAGETIRTYLSGQCLNYEWSSGAQGYVIAKWQYSVAGADSWTDIGIADNGSSGYFAYYLDTDYSVPSSIVSNETAAPTDGNYDVRLMVALDHTMPNSAWWYEGSNCSVAIGV